jgi:nucleotide-binding universal stress UspA family protein
MKILLAIDGSKFSDAAVEACKKYIESQLATEIRIVSVYEAQVPFASEPFVIAADCYQKLNDFARDRSTDCARKARELLKQLDTDDKVDFTIEVEMANPSSFIVEAAKRWGAEMIIVGSHGRGFFGRMALGSVSDSVVHFAPCSVLVVRSN